VPIQVRASADRELGESAASVHLHEAQKFVVFGVQLATQVCSGNEAVDATGGEAALLGN
jgi:hypothetical protein